VPEACARHAVATSELVAFRGREHGADAHGSSNRGPLDGREPRPVDQPKKSPARDSPRQELEDDDPSAAPDPGLDKQQRGRSRRLLDRGDHVSWSGRQSDEKPAKRPAAGAEARHACPKALHDRILGLHAWRSDHLGVPVRSQDP
jgi:hypothetical protein